MNLVFIYGPPAVGKLTIGKELEKLTGYKLLHNHLVLDLVGSLFDRESVEFKDLVKSMRLSLIESAAKTKTKGLIMSYAFSNTAPQREFVLHVKSIIEHHGGSMCFIRLSCDPQVLKTRVLDASRQAHGKIQSVETLDSYLQEFGEDIEVPNVDSLTIDTTAITPKDAALQIQQQYEL